MQTKQGKEVDVIGTINIDNNPHFIVRLKSPIYHVTGYLYKYVVLSESQVVHNNGLEHVEVVPSTTAGEIDEQKVDISDDTKDGEAER